MVMRIPQFEDGYRVPNGDDLIDLVSALTSTVDGIVAYPGGGSQFATLLQSAINRVTTVATPGDSVKLPPSFPGITVRINNAGNNDINVYASNDDLIDGNDNVSQLPNTSIDYVCTEEGQWYIFSEGTGGGGGNTNLSVINRTATSLTVASSTGSDAVIPDATTLLAGLLTAADKVKLNNAVATYTHTQLVAASQWVVNHNLGANPVIVGVFSPGGVEVQAQVTNTSVNQTVIDFVTPQTGTARFV